MNGLRSGVHLQLKRRAHPQPGCCGRSAGRDPKALGTRLPREGRGVSEPQGWVGLTGPRAHLAGHKGQGDPVLSLCGDQQVGSRPRGDTASFRQWGQNSLPLPSPQSPSGGGHLPQSQTAVRFHVQFIKNVVSLSFFPTQFIFAVVADGNQLLVVNTADQGGGRGTFCILMLDLLLVVTSLDSGQGGSPITGSHALPSVSNTTGAQKYFLVLTKLQPCI